MLVTEVDLTISAGRGGKGKVAFDPADGKLRDGGDGGPGGDVYIVGTKDLYYLKEYVAHPEQNADDGAPGETGKRPGLKGKDLILKFPLGCRVKDKKSGHVYTLEDTKTRIKVAKGGRGGRGNFSFRYYQNFSPTHHEKGLAGTSLEFFAELKLNADYGLIGLPNAGKSSLFNELTSAHVKVAAYPFTTIDPNVAKIGDYVLADIPGLIEGASQGKGLGSKFLKHVEQIKLFIHCVPMDSVDIVDEYETVCEELKQYNCEIAKRDKIIVLTKTDMFSSEEVEEKKILLAKYGYAVIPVSIHDWDAINVLKTRLEG